MKHLPLIAAMLVAVPAAQAAPLVDVYGGAYTWKTDTSGTIASGSADIDLERDLGYDDSRQNVIYVGVEHVVPLVPNARLRYMDLSDSGRNQLEREISFAGETFSANTAISSDYDLTLLDGTLYYSLMNNWVEVDLGLTIRQMSAKFSIASDMVRARESATVTFPLLHGAAMFNLPFTGSYAGIEANGLEVDGSRMVDYSAKVGWRSDFLLGVELGYSEFKVELDDVSNLDSDLTIGGPYLALSLSF